MRTFASLNIATAQAIARLYTITRRDGVVKRVTSWTNAIYIGGNVWVPDPGLKEYDISEKADGSPASSQLQLGVANDEQQFVQRGVLVAAGGGPPGFGPLSAAPLDGTPALASQELVQAADGGAAPGLITSGDLEDRQYEGATVLVQVCDPFNPAPPDFYQYFRVGDVSKPLYGTVTFALQNPHGFPRENLVPKFTVACRFPFGGAMCGMPVMRPDIARSTAYLLGAAGRFNSGTSPTGYGNVYFEATTAGATAGTAPTFNFTVGGTTTDGGVVWTARNAWERAFVVGTVVDPHNMRLAASVDPRDADGWFAPGKIMFVTGRDKGRVYRVAAWRKSDLTLATFIPSGLRVVAGDTGFIWPDCNKTPDNCVTPFNNRRRYGGFDKYDGAAAATQVF